MPWALEFLRQRPWLRNGAQPLRIFIALTGFLALCTAKGWTAAVIPLYLGAIANALGETDDTWRGRLRAEGVTLVFFAAATAVVQALEGRPALYLPAIAASAFGLTMMGALPARYKSIGFATIVFAMYTTIGLEGRGGGASAGLRESAWLLAGSSAYGLLSVAWSAVAPLEPVQARLVKVFEALGHYMSYKASLFEPLHDIDMQMKRLSLARLNAGVVAALNEARESILRRLRPGEPTGHLARYRGLYMVAQDVHERAGSSHDDYRALANTFFHSDLLYRCQRVLMLQGNACKDLAESIERRRPFEMGTDSVRALAELDSAIAWRRNLADPADAAPLASVEALADNLSRLDAQLAGASTPTAQVGRTDMLLADSAPRTLRAMAARVRREFTPGSALLRHALRLAIALSVGDVVTWWLHPAQGYWIMLTTLFVCRQTYGETVARLGQRSAGTLVGVVIGWACLQLFPQPPVQALLAVAAGVLFSATRLSRYQVATAAMTVLVLLCSNQVGHGAVLIVPRLVDTLIGCAIAWVAVLMVFPHWQSRRFGDLAAAALRGHADYLGAVVRQYGGGVHDDQPYRAARRRAHDADAALATAVVDMYREPGRTRPRAGAALRFMIQAHTLLNYISALGAHRSVLEASRVAALADESAVVAQALRELARLFDGLAAVPGPAATDPPAPAPRTDKPTAPQASSRMISAELALIRGQVVALQALAQEWLAGA
jgi:YccS/YhfK family integral membrane protein